MTLLSLHEREKDVTQKKNKSVANIWKPKTKSRGTNKDYKLSRAYSSYG